MITTNCSSESPVTVTAVMYLTEEDQSLLEKLENPEYRNKIDTIAKDMHINWAVVKAYDNENLNLEVSRTFDYTVTVTDRGDVKKACIKFAEEVSMLTLPAFDEPKCPTHEPANEDAEVIAERLAFCKEVRKDMDDTENIHVIGAKLVAGHKDCESLIVCAGRIGAALLKELLDVYIGKYDHE
jgi:hypothetical protein